MQKKNELRIFILGLVTSGADRMRLLQARRKCPLEELAMEAARGLTG